MEVFKVQFNMLVLLGILSITAGAVLNKTEKHVANTNNEPSVTKQNALNDEQPKHDGQNAGEMMETADTLVFPPDFATKRRKQQSVNRRRGTAPASGNHYYNAGYNGRPVYNDHRREFHAQHYPCNHYRG